MISFVLGIAVLVFDVWALINVWGSGAALLAKILWTLLILIAPIVGVIIWYLVGPKSGQQQQQLVA